MVSSYKPQGMKTLDRSANISAQSFIPWKHGKCSVRYFRGIRWNKKLEDKKWNVDSGFAVEEESLAIIRLQKGPCCGYDTVRNVLQFLEHYTLFIWFIS